MSDYCMSDISSDNGEHNISDIDDFITLDDNLSNYSGQDMDIDIDMDDNTNNNTNNNTNMDYPKKILGKLVNNKQSRKEEIKDTTQETIKKEKKIIPDKKKVNIVKKTNSNSNTESKKSEDKKETKESKDDAKFDFNEQTIEFFSRDLDLKNICIKKSHFKNDTALLCLLFKAKVFKEYRCNIKKCKTGKTWLGKPIQLLINRKNSRVEDLTIENLELICPNCFIVLYGLDLFQKALDQTIYKCKICSFPLSKFANSKKKEGYCMSCQNKIINSSFYSKQTEYINELKDTIDEDSTLKEDEFTTSKYYNEVSQFKTFKDSSSKSKSKTNTNDKPIINVNMNIPDLYNLINEDVME